MTQRVRIAAERPGARDLSSCAGLPGSVSPEHPDGGDDQYEKEQRMNRDPKDDGDDDDECGDQQVANHLSLRFRLLGRTVCTRVGLA